ncbi:hypothetical protein M0M42_16920 [Pseudomonas knackmussii]|uniref:Lipoprotein n=1 Tax=Pseudomonas knackmussii TaxID=65741 RepID=A0ABY4KMK1_9PSED|nr:hypothetical protein [Pseudomonas knackmussii]UPQ82066.1 hypothetical protein M0M42_16920 [Pseudomonas knackmussii]
MKKILLSSLLLLMYGCQTHQKPEAKYYENMNDATLVYVLTKNIFTPQGYELYRDSEAYYASKGLNWEAVAEHFIGCTYHSTLKNGTRDDFEILYDLWLSPPEQRNRIKSERSKSAIYKAANLYSAPDLHDCYLITNEWAENLIKNKQKN